MTGIPRAPPLRAGHRRPSRRRLRTRPRRPIPSARPLPPNPLPAAAPCPPPTSSPLCVAADAQSPPRRRLHAHHRHQSALHQRFRARPPPCVGPTRGGGREIQMLLVGASPTTLRKCRWLFREKAELLVAVQCRGVAITKYFRSKMADSTDDGLRQCMRSQNFASFFPYPTCRGRSVYMTKLAEQAKRYWEMVEYMEKE